MQSLEGRVLLSATAEQTALDQGYSVIRWQHRDQVAKAGEWIVSFDQMNGTAQRQVRKITRQLGAVTSKVTVLQHLGQDGLFLIKTKPTTRYRPVLRMVQQVSSFEYLEPNLTLQPAATVPNDPSFAVQWALKNTGQSGGTVGADIDATLAWDLTTGSGSIVAMLDTGVNYNHPDLAGNIWHNPGEIPGDGIDNDGNGFIDDYNGWDFADDDNDPSDTAGHGTQTAGIVAAVGNNTLGVSGVAWSAGILPLRFIGGAGGEVAAAIAAVNYVVMMHSAGANIRVINASFGSTGSSAALKDAIENAGDEGILFVAAAGNSGANNDDTPFYPASYNLPNIIAVANTDRNDALAGTSCYGATSVDLGAPGQSIYTTIYSSSYADMSGTSFAAPMVSGVAALAFSLLPRNTSYTVVRDAIFSGGDSLPSLSGKTVTGMRLNAYGTLMQLPMNALASTPAIGGGVVSTAPTSFTIEFSHPYNPASVSASDLLVNGTAANSFSFVDPTTVSFNYTVSPVVSEGSQAISMANGAVSRASDGATTGAFSGTFRYDPMQMQVISVTPANGSIVAPPVTQIDVQLNEDVVGSSVGTGDLVLSSGSVTGYTILGPRSIRFSVSGLTGEANVSYSIPAGAFTDAAGNASVAYAGDVKIDVGMKSLSTLLSPLSPLGSGIYGPVIDGMVNFAGDGDSYTIALTKGQKLSVAVAGAVGLRPRIELRDAGYGLVTYVTASGAGLPALLQNFQIATSGTYTVVITGDSSTSGAYKLRVAINAEVEREGYGQGANNSTGSAQTIDGSISILPNGTVRGGVIGQIDWPTGVLPTEMEPNNGTSSANSAAANFASFGGSVYHMGIKGSLSSSSDIDCYKLGTLQAGSLLTVSLSGASSSRGTFTDPYVQIYRGSQFGATLLLDNNDSGPGTDALIHEYTIGQSDNYYVVVMTAGTSGTYDLGIMLEPAGFTPNTSQSKTAETESNDGFGNATDISRSWRRVQYQSITAGTITSGDVDVYAYQFTAGDLVSVNIAGEYPLDAKVFLRNSNGNAIASEDGTSVGPRQGSPIYGFIIPSDGTYYVEVQARSGTGSYAAKVCLSSSTAPASSGVASADYYAITLVAGQSVFVSLGKSTAGAVAIDLRSYGNGVLATSSSSSNIDQMLSYTAPTGGTYYIRVSGDASVEYALSVAIDTAVDVEANNTFATAQSLGDFGRAIGWIGDEDWYQFSAAAGELLQVRSFTWDALAGLDPVIEIYDPTGALVASDDNSAGDGRNAMVTYVAGQSGAYRARVLAGSGAGEYALLMTNFSDGVHGTAGSDVFRLVRAGENLEIYLNASVGDAPTWTLPIGVASSLQLNGGDHDDLLMLDLSGGDLMPSGGLSFDGEWGSNSIQVVGTGGNDALTLSSDSVSTAGGGMQFNSVGEISFDGGDGDDTLTLTETLWYEWAFSATGGSNALEITGGVHYFNDDIGLMLSDLNVSLWNDAYVSVWANQHLGQVSLNGNARLDLSWFAGDMLLVADSLSIEDSAVLDLGNNNLLLRTGMLSGLRALIISGRNGGTWDGAGLISSQADASYALGYARGDDALVLPDSIFGGEVITSSSLIVRYTMVGDADLDRDVDASDVAKWALNFTGELSGSSLATKHWASGDWDYDGDVDASDVAKWALNFTGELSFS